MSTFDQKPCKDGPRARKPRRRLEAELEQQCTDFLALDGWRSIKTDPPQLRGLGVLEKGMADRLYIRYRWRAQWNPAAEEGPEAIAEVLWVEFKAPGGVLKDHQAAWHLAEAARGGLTWIAGHDFPADFDSFVAFYRASGLLRRKGL